MCCADNGCTLHRGQIALCSFLGATGFVLMVLGASQLPVCDLQPQLANCTSMAQGMLYSGLSMMIVGAAVLAFFWFTAPRPAPKKPQGQQAAPQHSAITVVQRGQHGEVYYQYDAQGHLVEAPDCRRSNANVADYIRPGTGRSPKRAGTAAASPHFSPLGDQAHRLSPTRMHQYGYAAQVTGGGGGAGDQQYSSGGVGGGGDYSGGGFGAAAPGGAGAGPAESDPQGIYNSLNTRSV